MIPTTLAQKSLDKMTFNLETEKLKSIRVEVKSSFIDFVEYSRSELALTVKYKKKGLFQKKVKRYEEVSIDQFFEMLNSKSVGKAFMKLRRDKHKNEVY